MTTAFHFLCFTAKVDTLKKYRPPQKILEVTAQCKDYYKSSVPKNMTDRLWAVDRRVGWEGLPGGRVSGSQPNISAPHQNSVLILDPFLDPFKFLEINSPMCSCYI